MIVGKNTQDHEFIYPYYRVQEAGFEVDVAIRNKETVKCILGVPITPTRDVAGINVNDYDLLVLPGGAKAMEKIRPGWHVKGVYNEACAAEGHCPFYFERDKEGGCSYFMVLRIQEGKVNDVDLSGITVMYLGVIAYSKYKELLRNGEDVGGAASKAANLVG